MGMETTGFGIKLEWLLPIILNHTQETPTNHEHIGIHCDTKKKKKKKKYV